MCGLVGVAGDCTVKNKDIFGELLLVDVVRGHHSTGVAMVKRYGNEIVMEKAPVPSPIFLGTEQYKKAIETAALKCMIGHNRYATIGEKTALNAHPFMFPNLVGAHNGTLDQWSLKSIPDWNTYGTDSEALYSAIADHGLKDTINEMTGAWALTYYSKEGGTMNMLRNDKRPLFYTYSDDRESLYWSSEADMLEWVLKRNKVKLFENSIYEIEVDRHYKWAIPEKMGGKFDKPVVAVVEGHTFQHVSSKTKYESYGTPTNGTVGSNSAYSAANVAHTIIPSVTHSPSKKGVARSKVNTSKFRPPYTNAYGRVVNKVAFNEITKSGCVFCDEAKSQWGDFVHFIKDDMDGRKLYMCVECYNDDDIYNLIQKAM